MKLSKFLFIALAMSFLFVRCEKNTPQEEAQVVTIDTDNDLLDEYELPVFPSEVLHVIHREYVIMNPNLVTKSDLILDTGYVKHVESRLITMFPNDAFVGLIAYSDSVMADILASAPTYIDTLEFVESDTIPSFGMEAKILALDSTESIAWNEFETLAQGFNLGTPATLEDILDASTSAKTSGVLG